jgi:hypothetical protein
VNTYITGGTFNSTTVAPVVAAVAALNSYVASHYNNPTLTNAETQYQACYTHLTNEISLLSLAGISVVNPLTTPNHLPDLARTITTIGADSYQLGLIPFFTNLSTLDVNGDNIRAVIAEGYNTQILQNKGILVNNSVNPASKLAQAQSFGVSVATLQQLAQ